MRVFILTFLFYFFIERRICLWSNGVVHYVINKKAYDENSRDIIISVLNKLQNEICVKFFNIPVSYGAEPNVQVLYINNPDKRKDCSPQEYNLKSPIVDMIIGYKCLNERDITRMAVDMLRASIRPIDQTNSIDQDLGIQEGQYSNDTSLINPEDRNYINVNYHNECSKLGEQNVPTLRMKTDRQIVLSTDNEEFYKDKIWPLGIVLYGVEDSLHSSDHFKALRQAMSTIEVSSCVVFQPIELDEVLLPKNFLWFANIGEIMPRLGFTEGKQTLSMVSMVKGAPGHTAHTLNMLMRVLGVPMMSNRYDRDSYVSINWKNVQKGMEHYLERMPMKSFVRNSDGYNIPYDYTSVTHAPVNYLCEDCTLGQQTVTPVKDHLWQRTLTMGHRTDLNPADIEMLNSLYRAECQNRYIDED